MSLTRRQRQILWLMREADGPTLFAGGTRRFHWYRLDGDHPGALLIKAYQSPEFFLEARGLLARAEMNVPGRWYRLTEAGSRAAERIVEMPK